MKRNKIMDECCNNMDSLSLYERLKIRFAVWYAINLANFCRGKRSKKDYIKIIKSNLVCNNDDICTYFLYDYTNEQIDYNIKYFLKCRKHKLSPYKALLFFNDYLENKSK